MDVEVPEKHGFASDRYYDAGEVITFADNLEYAGLVTSAMEYVVDIVDDSYLDEIVRQIVEDGGWQRVKHFLSNIDSMADGYYYINGYADVETLTSSTLDAIVSNLMDKLKHSTGV